VTADSKHQSPRHSNAFFCNSSDVNCPWNSDNPPAQFICSLERRGWILVSYMNLAKSCDYAQREYAATPEQIAAFAAATDKRYRRLKRSGKLVTVSTEQLRNLLE